MNAKEEFNSETWERVEQIYQSAVTLERSKRNAYVSRACAGDMALYEEVSTLLAAEESSGNFLQEPVAASGLRILANEKMWQKGAPFAPTLVYAGDLSGLILDNRYEVIEWIGGGGMGDVYKAVDTRMLERLVVVKVLKADASANKRLVSKFKQEIEASNKIDAIGVVSFFDFGELPDGRPYLVMQYVEGQALREAIPPGQGMDFQEVAEIISQIGRTLNIAHEKGIIHRDLKPENIMLRRDTNGDLQVKVIDFGIAKIKASLVAASTSVNHVIGTPCYMSPEQLNPEELPKREVSTASDIYSLGIIAYEIVTGRRPFNAESIIHLADLQKKGVQLMPCALRPALSEAAQKVILKALCYHPAERYQRVRDFCDDLSRALSEEVVKPAPVPVPVPIPSPDDPQVTLRKPPPARHRRLLFAAVATLLFAGLVFAGLVSAGLWMKFFRSGPERTFSYFLKVQKMRDGVPFEQPFISSGQEIYEKGYKMQVVMMSRADGYVYLFNEGTDDKGRNAFFLQFPTPQRNNGAARITAGQQFESGWNTFKWEPGTELIWFIWTARPEPELEVALAEAVKNDGKVPAQAAASLQAFLKRGDESRAVATKEPAEQRTALKGFGDVVIHPLRLEYR